MTAYVAAKEGLEAAVRTIAAETGRHGVTANVVIPGMFMTKIMDNVADMHDSADPELNAAL
jgi:NAD(P)-dependent dehydrogenase (short-subunit alcohol dehydrogenase family)